MAEPLGRAELVLGVDLQGFEAGLQRAQAIAKERGETINKSLALRGFGSSQVATTITNDVQKIGGAFGNLAAGVSLLQGSLATLGVAAVVKQISDVGIAAESANNRLNSLSGRFGETAQAQLAAAEAAKLLNLSQTEAANGFAQLYASLRPTGVSLKDIETIFVGVTAAAKNTGLGAESVNNALIQLTQGLASGRLQGDELRSVLEQLPPLSQAIAKELGVPVGALKQLGSEGKISTDIIIRALQRLKSEELGQLSKSLNTSQEKLKALSVEAQNFQKELSTAFGPAAIEVVGGLTRAFRGLAEAIRQANLANQYPKLAQQADKQAGDLVQAKIGPLGGSGFFGGVTVQYGGKTYSGTATGVKNDITKAILTELIKGITGPGGGQKPTPIPQPPATPSATVLAAGKKSKEDLEVLQQTVNLAGIDLKFAEGQIKIQRSIREEARLQAEYAKAKAAANAAGGKDQNKNTLAKEAGIRLETAANNVKTANIEFSKLSQDAAADTALFEDQTKRALVNQQQRLVLAKQIAAIDDQGKRGQITAAQGVVQTINDARKQQGNLGLQLLNQLEKGAGSETLRETASQFVQAGKDVEIALINGGRQLRDLLLDATKQFNQALTSNFDILNESGKRVVLDEAQKRIVAGVQTGLIDPTKIPGQSDAQAFIAFSQQAGAVADAFGNLTTTQQAVNDANTKLATVNDALTRNTVDLVATNGELVGVISNLAEKDWGVNVSVFADGTSQAYGDVVNRAI